LPGYRLAVRCEAGYRGPAGQFDHKGIQMKRFFALSAAILVAGAFGAASTAGASNPSCAAQFVTAHAGPGFGQAVGEEAQSEGRAFGQETKGFGTAPHNDCPVIPG
jgi:hypothetical protein